MKTTIKKSLRISFVLIIGFILGGCAKDLNLTNPNVQTAATFWQNQKQAVLGVTGIYQALMYDGSFMRFTPVYLDSRDDITWSPSPWNAIYAGAQFDLLSTNYGPEAMYVAWYDLVKRANLAIANIPKIKFQDEALKTRLMGEAYFLRGLAYFYIVTFWHHVPLILTPPQSSKDFYAKQVDASKVWAQIIKDFTTASNDLPETYDAANLGRATRGAALAYLGKAYLFNKDYKDGAAAFKKVIDEGVYGLLPASQYANNFNSVDENNQESIFEVQFQRMNEPTLGWVGAPGPDWDKTSARAITYAPPPFGWGDMAVRPWLYKEFTKEKTVDGKLDPRLYATLTFDYPGCTLYGQKFRQAFPESGADTVLWKTMFFARKYENVDSGRPNEFDWRSGINERLMRYSDVLLMYAECELDLGNIPEAAHYIHIVRARADLPNREAEFASDTKAQVFAQLVHQRILEFALEGHRFDDIRRWGWLSDPAMLDTLKAHDAEYNGYIPGKEYLPIPNIEIQNNPNAVQNPTY